MSRSRSSFDLSGAIATAASLSVVVPEERPSARYRGPLVSFGLAAGGPPTRTPPPQDTEALAVEPVPAEHALPDPVQAAVDEAGPVTLGEAAEGPAQPVSTGDAPEPPTQPLAFDDAPRVEGPPAELEAGPAETARRPPKLPDLSEVKSLLVRCQKIIEWIVEAVAASEVFIADAAGLPIAGAITDAEARLGATGVVASAVAHLAAAIPGNSSALFEMHVGDGPFFQLIGFEVAAQSYVVGFHRPTPLGFRQAHAVRLACRHALAVHDGAAAQTGADDGGQAQGRGGVELGARQREAQGEAGDHAPAGGET